MILEYLLAPDNIPYILATLVIILFIIGRKKHKNLPPGPPGYPLLGNLGQISSGNQVEIFRRMRAEYGNIFSLYLGTRLYIVFNGYETLKETFVKHGDNFSDRPHTFMMKLISKDRGLSGSSGEIWKKTRTFTISSLRDFGFGRRSLEHKIMKEVDAFMKTVENSDGEPMDIRNTSLTSIANVICSIVFGERYDYNDKHFTRLLDLLDQNFKLAGLTGILSFFPVLRFLPWDQFGVKRLIRNIEEIRQFFVQQVEDHKKAFDENEIKDFIDVFLKEKQNHTEDDSIIFTDANLTTLIGNIFSAGTETTATAIRWSIIYLVREKHIQDAMRTEVDKIVGTSRPISVCDRHDLPYCEAFIMEVLRHANIAPLSVPRGATQDAYINGFLIPKDAVLIPNLDSVLADPEIFSNPEVFDPTRFIGEDGKLSGTDKVIAFSIGRRSCPGESLARMELFLFLTTLVQKFILLPAGDVPPLDGVLGITRSPKPYKFRAIKRNTEMQK